MCACVRVRLCASVCVCVVVDGGGGGGVCVVVFVVVVCLFVCLFGRGAQVITAMTRHLLIEGGGLKLPLPTLLSCAFSFPPTRLG